MVHGLGFGPQGLDFKVTPNPLGERVLERPARCEFGIEVVVSRAKPPSQGMYNSHVPRWHCPLPVTVTEDVQDFEWSSKSLLLGLSFSESAVCIWVFASCYVRFGPWAMSV